MTDKLVERLREKHHNGQFTMGGASFGPDGHKSWGGEKILVYRNPDGPEAAAEIERLQAALDSLTRPQTSDLEQRALEIIAQMGGYTKLYPDETASPEVQNAYSEGVSHGYRECAEIAREALTGASRPAEWNYVEQSLRALGHDVSILRELPKNEDGASQEDGHGK